MIRVMIVEDEYLIRELIKTSIDWKENGFEIIAEAEDGEQALYKLEAVDPQLLLVDINMPFMNGLELAEIVYDKYSHIKVIILTGYSEFEYAKQAIKAGIISYILKPINEKEMLEALSEVRKQIIENEDHSGYVDLLEAQTGSRSKTTKEKFLHSVVYQPKYSEDKIEEKTKYYFLKITNSFLQTVIIQVDYLCDQINYIKDEQLWLFAIANLAEDIFGENHACEVFTGKDKQIIVIMNSQESDFKTNKNACCLAACYRLKQVVSKYLGFTLTIGVSKIHKGFSEIYVSYSEAQQALKQRYIEGTSSILEFEIEDCYKGEFDFLEYANREQILFHLRKKEDTQYVDIIDTIFQTLRKNKVEQEYVNAISMEIISIAVSFLFENNGQIEKLFEANKSCLDTLKEKQSIEDVKDWVISLFNKAQHIVLYSEESSQHRVIKEVKDYIDDHYMQSSLSLDELASQAHMNPSYLSNLFKREAGHTITDYAKKIRMIKAKEIIDSGRFNQISKVSEAVGYTDPYYFSKCFKRYFGVTYTEYINRKQ